MFLPINNKQFLWVPGSSLVATSSLNIIYLWIWRCFGGEQNANLLNDTLEHQEKKKGLECTGISSCRSWPPPFFPGRFYVLPIEETLSCLSMTRSTGLGLTVFIGFQNYVRLFQSEEFLMGLKTFSCGAFWSVLIQIPFSFFIAFSLSVF